LRALETKTSNSAPSTPSTNPGMPLADCFRSDLGVASTDWKSHRDWAQNQNSEKLNLALDEKLATLFRCRSRTDEQLFDTFADISMVFPRYFQNVVCFNGDAGVISINRASHRSYASSRGRSAALARLQYKVVAGLNCLEGAKRFSYYADISVLVAGGALTNNQ